MDEVSLKSILKSLGIKVAMRSGNWLNFSCPFAPFTHKSGKDSTPSCGASVNENGISGYKCFTCHKHGRISGMVRALEYYQDEDYGDLAFKADMADAHYAFGQFEHEIEERDELDEPLSEAAYADIYMPAWEHDYARHYLSERGIGKETADYLGLGYDPLEARITFPVRHSDGGLYGFTGRSVLPPDRYPYKGYEKVRDYLGLPKRHLILGAHLVKEKSRKPIFVVEGLFGYAHLFEIGADDIVHPVALLGSEMTKSKAALLMEWNRLTVLALDNDAAGEDGLFGAWDDKRKKNIGGGAVDMLENHLPLIVPPWPSGKKDPDELTFRDVEKMTFETDLWR